MKEEYLSTSLCFVEQAMNSRPLVPASSDPTDLNVLSPSNFHNCGEVLLPAVFAREPRHAHHLRVYTTTLCRGHMDTLAQGIRANPEPSTQMDRDH